MLEQARHQDRPDVLLDFGRLAQQQHVLVVRQVQLPARLLVLVDDVVQLAAGSAS